MRTRMGMQNAHHATSTSVHNHFNARKLDSRLATECSHSNVTRVLAASQQHGTGPHLACPVWRFMLRSTFFASTKSSPMHSTSATGSHWSDVGAKDMAMTSVERPTMAAMRPKRTALMSGLSMTYGMICGDACGRSPRSQEVRA
jgi:hypothetical protein